MSNDFSARASVQTPPIFFTSQYHPLWLGNLYAGRSVFLIGGGPSFATVDHSKLCQPGIVTMGVNNSTKTFRSQLWVGVDPPHHFIKSIWLDPKIMKFAPIRFSKECIFDSGSWQFMDMRVCDCPNVAYFRQNERFQADQFLWQDTVNWGNHQKYGGGRSVMLAALRILYVLGFRRVYLLGVDFRMDEKCKYHFAQDRTKGSIAGNNNTYRRLQKWLAELRPFFETHDYSVFNCNPDSRLMAFDYIPYDQAVREVMQEFGNVDVSVERTEGHYDNKAKR